MSHQVFILPSTGRLKQSSSGSSLSLCSPYTGDRHAQQASYMGCPGNSHLGSFSPSVENDRQVTIPSSRPSISPYQMTSPITMYQSNPRIMYPSSTYLHGNPGFYYDLMQNSTHTGSQMNMFPPPTDYVPTPTPMPTHLPTPASIHIPTPTSTHTHYYLMNFLTTIPSMSLLTAGVLGIWHLFGNSLSPTNHALIHLSFFLIRVKYHAFSRTYRDIFYFTFHFLFSSRIYIITISIIT